MIESLLLVIAVLLINGHHSRVHRVDLSPRRPYGWVDHLPDWVDWVLIPRTKWRLRNKHELPGKT